VIPSQPPAFAKRKGRDYLSGNGEKMAQRYTIAMLLKMKEHFTANPDEKTIVGYDDFRLPIIQDGKGFHRWFVNCLHEKINTKGNLPQHKKAYDPFQIGFMRDKTAIERKVKTRVPIYQFESKICRRRLAHLMDDRNDF
jgi:hypothetical protein